MNNLYKIVESKLNTDNTTDLTLQTDDGSELTLLSCYPIEIEFPKNNIYGQTTNNPQIVLKYDFYFEDNK